VIHSPEQVALHLATAGPASRMLAYCIDASVIVAFEIAVLVGLILTSSFAARVLEWLQPWLESLERGEVQGLQGSSTAIAFLGVALVAQFGIELVYFLLWEAVSGGRSLGKWWVGLRVVGDDGGPLGWQQSLMRNLLRIADMLPGTYGVGLVAMVLSRQGQRLGDLAAATLVVRLDRPQAAPSLATSRQQGSAAFRFDRAQIQRIGSAERMLLRRTLRRVDELPPQQGSDALRQATDALCARIGHPTVAAEEQRSFLLALLDAVDAG
jgi:uncharacterized RDD family membrane protein YckC